MLSPEKKHAASANPKCTVPSYLINPKAFVTAANKKGFSKDYNNVTKQTDLKMLIKRLWVVDLRILASFLLFNTVHLLVERGACRMHSFTAMLTTAISAE